MAHAPDLRRMTYDEYLALEASGAEKHEYVNGEVLAMAGCSPEHGRLASRFARLVGATLTGRPCDTFSSDVRIRIESTKRSTYPDLSIVCGKLERSADDPNAITNPRVIVEVLSESTEAADRGDKWAHYQRIPSLEEYVLVSQHEQRVEVFRRGEQGWVYEAVTSGRVELPSVGGSVELDELYTDPLAG
jgi:Uma2 family endonuclease